MEKTGASNGLLRPLRENWFIVIAMVSIVASWVTLDSRVKVVEEAFAKHCTSQDHLETDIQEWRTETREMKRDLAHLGESIQRAEETQKEILRELRQ